ncbi:MAG: GNAT family N-acetyltransferase [Terracidiphilus sp.]|nr:GNAT family N-acetyltransferase [Terracidiphilus sp.]
MLKPAVQLAAVEDSEEILALQKLCFQNEAALYNDNSIPPLTQTLAELQHEFVSSRFLKIVLDSKIIASVRGKIAGDTCHIGRLIVHPSYQGRGLGTRLMSMIEREFANAKRFEIFTGSRSLANLRLYERLGYREVRRVAVSGHLELVFLQKSAG